MDPSSKRTAKVEHFKTTKALNARLESLEEQRSRSMKNKDEVSGENTRACVQVCWLST
jgi:hypothetical protein